MSIKHIDNKTIAKALLLLGSGLSVKEFDSKDVITEAASRLARESVKQEPNCDKLLREALEAAWYAMEKHAPDLCSREIGIAHSILEKYGQLLKPPPAPKPEAPAPAKRREVEFSVHGNLINLHDKNDGDLIWASRSILSILASIADNDFKLSYRSLEIDT